jgi:CO/xanthine dehydrogenase FAD-binding subunit
VKTEFFKPATLSEALALLDKYQEKAVIVNGGTDIVIKITQREVNPEAIIYIQGIAELKEIKEVNGDLVLGGAVTYTEVENSSLCKKYDGLIQAVSEIGSPPIRNMATPAGNIANAAPAADCNVMLLALKAEVVLASSGGERSANIQDIFAGPFKTVIKPNELIKEIRIPQLTANTHTSFIKMTRRKAQDIARVSVGVSLTTEGSVCRDIKIALGAINKFPVRAYTLEEAMIGKEVERGVAEIKEIFPPEATPRKSYKRLVTNVIIERAIRKAYRKAAAGGEHVG